MLDALVDKARVRLPEILLIVIITLFGSTLFSISANEPYLLNGELRNIESGRMALTPEHESTDGYNLINILSSLIFEESDNQAAREQTIQNTRIVTIIISILLILLIYIFSVRFLGKWWALLPVMFLATNPNILGHGHYINPYFYSGLVITATIFLFIRQLTSPSKTNITMLTLAYTLTILDDFLTITILMPYFLITTILLFLVKLYHTENWRQHLYRYGRLIFYLIAVTSLTGAILYSIDNSWATDIQHNFMQEANMSESLRLFMAKETVPMIILIVFTGLWAIMNIIKATIRSRPALDDYIATNVEEFSIIVFISIYFISDGLLSSQTNIQSLIVVIPLVYILVSAGIKNMVKSRFWDHRLKLSVLGFFILSQTAFIAASYPDYISYFNVLHSQTERWITFDSTNYDLGQNLKEFRSWIENNAPEEKIAFDYYDESEMRQYIGEDADRWVSSYGDPSESGISWLAISTSSVEKALDERKNNGDPENQYLWLKNIYDPYHQIGRSIFLYKLQ